MCAFICMYEAIILSIMLHNLMMHLILDPTKLKYCGKKYKPKTADEARKIKGTMGYRAPEVCTCVCYHQSCLT